MAFFWCITYRPQPSLLLISNHLSALPVSSSRESRLYTLITCLDVNLRDTFQESAGSLPCWACIVSYFSCSLLCANLVAVSRGAAFARLCFSESKKPLSSCSKSVCVLLCCLELMGLRLCERHHSPTMQLKRY